jgi:hypothetical protein
MAYNMIVGILKSRKEYAADAKIEAVGLNRFTVCSMTSPSTVVVIVVPVWAEKPTIPIIAITDMDKEIIGRIRPAHLCSCFER